MYQIKKTCPGCHTCAMNCPVDAIHYEGLDYVIDQEKCIGCGTCYEVCPTCNVVDTEAPSPVPHEPKKLRCDVAVCGGGSGVVAAVRAAQTGRKVILVEKARKLGGNTTLAHGFMVPYSKMHAAHGVPDGRDKLVEGTFRRADSWIPKKMIHTALYGITDFFDWLCQFPGTNEAFTYEEGSTMPGPMGGDGVSYNRRHFESLDNPDPSIGPGWMGTFVVHTMLNAIKEQDLDVTILTETAARHLVMNEDGSVGGVICEDGGGTVEIRAGAVILATGGMGQSDEKLQKYFGFFDFDREVKRFSVPGDTGDAIDMLEEIGVKPDRDRMFLSMFGPAHHPWSYCLYRVLAHPTMLVLNRRCERFFDETGNHFMSRMYANALPGGDVWGITTEENIDYLIEDYRKHPQFGDDPSVYLATRKELEEEVAAPGCPTVKADSLEELAEKIGYDKDALIAAVERYNAMCVSGVDTEFGKASENLRALKNGPYYAVYGVRFSEGAFGGLLVDSECRVCRSDGAVIPGLYGVGDATSTMHRQTVLAPVSELTWAMASSYISGGNAAAYTD